MAVVIMLYIIQGVVFGLLTNKILENRGYDDNWFWWGFFFGVIAMVLAASKPEVSYNRGWEKESVFAGTGAEARRRADADDEGWEDARYQREESRHTELDTIELINKYKGLLDSGALTQEEFDKKKCELLEN